MEKIMTIEQTVEITPSRRLTLEIPEGVPLGRAQVIIQFPPREDSHSSSQPSGSVTPPEARGQITNEAFRRVLNNAYGAWKDTPWINHREDINAMREEWDRDIWNRQG